MTFPHMPSRYHLSYVQVSEYAQRFNLSVSLAASISNLSAWLSSILLLTILAVVAHAQHSLTTAQATASFADLIAAVRRPLLAVSITAAAVLLISIPVSANLAKKSQRQGPKHLQATAVRRGNTTTAGVQADAPFGGVSNSAVPGGVVSSIASNDGASSEAVNDESPAASDAGKEGPAEQPDEDTVSEPSTLPSNHSFASEADSPPQTLSEMVDSGHGELGASSSTTDGQGAPGQQLPDASSEVGPDQKKGFFRDIESNCLPRCRQRQSAFGPKRHEFGNHRTVGMQRLWLARRRTSFMQHSITCRQCFSVLR